MSTRKRQNKSTQDLPDNLYEDRKGSKTYYRYRLPDGRFRALKPVKEEAIAAAKALNIRFAPLWAEQRADKIIQRYENPLSQGNPTVNEVIDGWLKEPCALAPSTRDGRLKDLEYFKSQFGKKKIQDVRTYDIAQSFKDKTENSKKRLRNSIKQVWVYAMENGFTDDNPVSNTKAPKQPPRIRQRHTWQGFQSVLDVAPEWGRNTMLLALHTLQRRGDLVTLTWNKVNMIERTFYVKQGKTGAELLIGMSDELHEIFQFFHDQMDPKYPRKRMDTPYVVHRRPEKRTKSLMDAVHGGKQDLFQITPDTMSQQFKHWRDLTDVYDHLERLERPSWHDIRALGIFILSKAGYPVEYIQALAGHADAEMTRKYMVGHEQVRPVEVATKLSIATLDLSNVDWNERMTPSLEKIASERE